MAAPANHSLQVPQQYPSPGIPQGSAEECQTRSRTLLDLARLAERSPLKWLVPSTVIEGGIHVVYGKEESFKTTLVMQLLEALNVGGPFLDWELPGGLKVGFAELEMTEKIFGERALRFMRSAKKEPNISVLSTAQRRRILDGGTAKERVGVLLEWVREESLKVLAVDSVAKLFPPGANPNSQPETSDVFNQLQKLGCSVILIAHPRKGDPKAGLQGNDEIAGSGRFAQDPDIVLEVRRPDKRAPKVVLSWGKNRMDSKPEDLEVFFDALDFRLHPRHPFLHLLPATREQLLLEAQKRYGWKRSNADDAIAELLALKDPADDAIVQKASKDRQAVYSLNRAARVKDSGKVAAPDFAQEPPSASPEDSGKVVGEDRFDFSANSKGHRAQDQEDPR